MKHTNAQYIIQNLVNVFQLQIFFLIEAYISYLHKSVFEFML